MSRNQSRKIGFTRILRRFVLLVMIGSSSPQTAEVGRTAEEVLSRAISSGRSGCTRGLPRRLRRSPCGCSRCCRMCCCRARSRAPWKVGRPSDLGCRIGGQLKPTDKAMAARSARTSSRGGSSCALTRNARFTKRSKRFHASASICTSDVQRELYRTAYGVRRWTAVNSIEETATGCVRIHLVEKSTAVEGTCMSHCCIVLIVR